MPGAELPPVGLIKDAILEAGDIALGFHRKSPRNWHKPDGTIVTEGDLAVDAFLRKRLTTAWPQAGWLSEESPDTPDRLDCQQIWVLDPIDGTRDFLSGGQTWCIGLALIDGGKPVLSAIYCPVQRVLYQARAGHGAFRGAQRLVLPPQPVSKATISPRSLAGALRQQGLDAQAGSSLPLLLRLVAVAEGHVAAAISLGPKNDWDIAAGHLVLTEAGGVASATSGSGLIYNRQEAWQPGLVAAHQAWHSRIIEITRQA